jgi:hypothetical protein
MPQWARDLLEGKIPDKDSEGWSGYLGWVYFGDWTPGLPEPNTSEAYKLIAEARSDVDQTDMPHT